MKSMSNIYLNRSYFEQNWRSQNFDFLINKNSSSNYTHIIEFSNTLLKRKNQKSSCRGVWVLHYFNFERNYGVLKSKIPNYF